jgi:hypothetical protein
VNGIESVYVVAAKKDASFILTVTKIILA